MTKFDASSIATNTQTIIENRTGKHTFDNELLEKLGTDIQAVEDALYFYNAVKDKSYLWVDEDMLKKHERQPGVILTDDQKRPRILHAYQSNMYWEGWVAYEDWHFEEMLIPGELPETAVLLTESSGDAINSYPFDENGAIRETPSTVHGFIVFH